ncbi:hypothetical protein [Halobellus marinus]|uniref:hypothetical protein n=1 Tax=Halobellus TaxID=1073986 RepID=UPI0028A9BBF7|nr:hypothetical protein [Halobellus sp. DFY28]
MPQQREGVGQPLEELPDADALDWTIVRSLLAANNATSQALESHLLHTYYDQDRNEAAESTEEYIERAIANHEQIIEDLRFARDLVDERQMAKR